MNSKKPLVVIGLDGFDFSLAETLVSEGELPHLARLFAKGARYDLDHGTDQDAGLTWEQLATGVSIDDGGRCSAIEFHPKEYTAFQKATDTVPVLDSLAKNTFVFDVPYYNLKKSRAEGVVGWGNQDPGLILQANPPELLAEIEARFGSYPAKGWLHACPGYSPKGCLDMGDALSKGIELRGKVAHWLLKKKEHVDLFYMGLGEIHAAIEGLWHGVDPMHPLHRHASAPFAAEALRKTYRAVDQFIGSFLDVAGLNRLMIFSPEGMGLNGSDLPSMLLLPELLYRHSFKRKRFNVPRRWRHAPLGVPQLKHGQSLNYVNHTLFRGNLIERFVRKLSTRPRAGSMEAQDTTNLNSLHWHPAMAYKTMWPDMIAFALPSFRGGQIRINLSGREACGLVTPADYQATCESLIRIIQQCKDPKTGESVIESVKQAQIDNPLDLVPSASDIQITWRGCCNSLEHPEYGMIGPVPFWRTGGHTDKGGALVLVDDAILAGTHGLANTLDVIPTLASMLGCRIESPVSGKSLIEYEEPMDWSNQVSAG